MKTETQLNTGRTAYRIVVPVILVILLIAVLSALFYIGWQRKSAVEQAPTVQISQDNVLLSDEVTAKAFNPQNVPPWLFVHVAIIALLQICALLAAFFFSQKKEFTKSLTLTVQFLCEIPMYLGLFGTLLGVCLTQFISGTLMAPLAYLTTMNGILLYVFGKLTIAIPQASLESDV